MVQYAALRDFFVTVQSLSELLHVFCGLHKEKKDEKTDFMEREWD